MAASGRAMKPEDILRIKWLSDPRVSPDGQRVAFVVTTLSEKRDAYLSTIWTIDADGASPPRRLTGGDRRDVYPRWSPDGRHLAFLSDRRSGERPQLYVVPSDGGEPHRLTDLPNGVREFAWSPDGARIVLVARVGGDEKPKEEGVSKPARVIKTMKYRMNGEGFVEDRPTHLFVVDVVGGEPRQITGVDDLDEAGLPFAEINPVWSPDGQSIAFVSARHAERDYNAAADVWIIPAEGGEPRRVTLTEGPVSRPSFSPDGKSIAYIGHRYPENFGPRNQQVFVVPAAGGPNRGLTDVLDRNCGPLLGGAAGGIAPIWTSDSREVRFVAEDQGRIPIFAVPDDGSAPPRVVVDGPRQVTSASASADGALLAFVASDPMTPAEIFVCRSDGGDERQLTDINRAWRGEVALSSPEKFQFERDGHRVDVWVMRPHGYEVGKRYPVLLNIHGGPASQYGDVFFDEFQVYTGAGYAVVFMNPRGSHGYGEAFARAILRDWGGGDYADIMAGLDEALARFDFLDPERLGVMGGSYGGYVTSWIVGHTDRFVAACSERAVNDNLTMFGTSDIGFWFMEQVAQGTPWEDRQGYIDSSPLTYAANITTPLLIIHAEDDLRCPIGQSEQLYIALKRLRREVLFVRFPEENHEMSRSGKPRHRLERFHIILDWFARHLPPLGEVV